MTAPPSPHTGPSPHTRPSPHTTSRQLPKLALAAVTLLAFALTLSDPSLAAAAAGPIDLSDMDSDERALFDKVTGGEMCPCGAAMSLAKCLPRPDVCISAVSLANLAASSIRKGLTYGEVVDAMIRQLERSSKPHQFDLKGRPRRGPADAPVTIVEFSDFECPHCSNVRPAIYSLLRAYPEKVAVVFKNFPLPFHEHSANAAAAGLIAHARGKFWEMHDLMFDGQNDLSEPRLNAFFNKLGIDSAKIRQAEWEAAKAMVIADLAEGDKSGVQATPTLYLNGIEIPGEDYNPDALKQRVKEALAAKGR